MSLGRTRKRPIVSYADLFIFLHTEPCAILLENGGIAGKWWDRLLPLLLSLEIKNKTLPTVAAYGINTKKMGDTDLLS